MKENLPKTTNPVERGVSGDSTLHNIIEREVIEELPKAADGGRRTLEYIVECDGQEHTRFKEEITYSATTNAPMAHNELAKEVIGPCEGTHK